MLKKVTVIGLLTLFALFSMAIAQQSKTSKKMQTVKERATGSVQSQKNLGQYLVTVSGCNDCHSPKQSFVPYPAPDSARLLSGHPANENIPTVPTNIIGPTAWGALTTNDLTAWAGPWGVSYPANLTPDQTTGMGAWTEQTFIQAMHTGKHMGAGRDILPPMPWYNLAKAKDADLRAIYSYLKSIPAITNQVPQPVTATQTGTTK